MPTYFTYSLNFSTNKENFYARSMTSLIKLVLLTMFEKCKSWLFRLVCPSASMVDLCWQEYFWFFGANLSRAWALVMTGFSYPIHSNPSQVKPIQSESSWVELNCVELSWAEWSRLNIRNLYILLINLLILGQLLFCLFADLVNPDRADQPIPESSRPARWPKTHRAHLCRM